MYERFTDRARKVMQLANQEAQRFNHEYIGTEHILLGLVKEGSGVAANVLKNLDVDLRNIRNEIEKIVQPGPDIVTKGKLPQTPRAKKVIQYAMEEARNLNHNYVGTEHKLLGLLREEEGVAVHVLMNLGVRLEDVREEIFNLLGHGMETASPPADPPKIRAPSGVQFLKVPKSTAELELQQRLIRVRRSVMVAKCNLDHEQHSLLLGEIVELEKRQLSLSGKSVSGVEAPWVAAASCDQLEAQLTSYLQSLCQGEPRTGRPLLVEPQVFSQFVQKPSPDLVDAVSYVVRRTLIELGYATVGSGTVRLTSHTWAFLLAIYNCVCSEPSPLSGRSDDVEGFTRTLIGQLVPARSVADSLVRHVLLFRSAEFLPDLTPERARLMHDLMNLSPLTALHHLHLHTPRPLTALAPQFLRGWDKRVRNASPWHDLDDWLDTVDLLLSDHAIAAYLRRRWLALPETRTSCRNLGLLFQALRQMEGYHDLLFEFYESYDYFMGAPAVDAWGGRYRTWPAIEAARRLLSAAGNTPAALQINRRGNEYFLKFRALIDLIIEEGGLPKRFNKLTHELIDAIRPLLDLTTEILPTGQQSGPVTFSSES